MKSSKRRKPSLGYEWPRWVKLYKIKLIVDYFYHLNFHDVPLGSLIVYQVNRHDQRNKNVCDLREGISTTFKIFWDFLFLRSKDQPGISRSTHHLIPLETKNKNIYGLGVEISTILGYLGTSCWNGSEPLLVVLKV